MNKSELRYCPSCRRVAYLPSDQMFLCGRHWEWGKVAWPIPEFIDESDGDSGLDRVLWFEQCADPGHGSSHHLTKAQFIKKYNGYIFHKLDT